MRIGIDLLWVKPQKSGGIEAYIRNLIDGFSKLEERNEYIMILAKDNYIGFNNYLTDSRFSMVICNIESRSVAKRIVWQNIKLNSVLKNHDINICFEPIYCKPIFNFRKIRYITTIHDLQALHYPEYFSKFKYIWMKFSWKRAINTSEKIVAISNFVKEDILKKYKVNPNKIQVIYNPIVVNKNNVKFKCVSDKFNIRKNEYYYTVAQLLPHKNLETIIKVMKIIKNNKINLPNKLLVSGINGKSRDKLISMINNYKLNDNIIFTGFIDNDERNTLYANCKAFLFPSVFEGFGMPPIEAMILGANVITTKETSLYEVTKGNANYVNNPFDAEEWIKKMYDIKNVLNVEHEFEEYDIRNVSKRYIQLFESINQLGRNNYRDVEEACEENIFYS